MIDVMPKDQWQFQNLFRWLYPQSKKGWKPKRKQNVEDSNSYHERNFVRPHKAGNDAGTDFFEYWKNSNTRIYDLNYVSIWKNRKHKRKVAKPEMTTEDNYLYCGCGCWYAVNLPPFEKRNLFVHYENIFSLILLFDKFRNI